MAHRKFTAFDSAIQKRAESAIAHGALTNSKRASSHVKGFYPTHLVKGSGPFVWDTKGNKYVDFICGLGSSILGYSHEQVNAAIASRLHMGATLSLGTPIEVEVAEKVKEMFPFVQKSRFLKTGTDACAAAIRIARGKTGRDFILSEGYHGWESDFCQTYGSPSPGVPYHAYIGKYAEDYADLKQVAAVIVEPVMTDYTDERRKWLEELRRKCTAAGTLLILDEVITGFRFPKYSVSEHWGIEPDLICLGKAMGNGMPISCVAGKTDVMEGSDYFVSSTFAGETLSLASALQTMKLLQTKYSIEKLWDKGAQFLYRFNELAPDFISIRGYPTRGVFRGDKQTLAVFFQEACRAGILFGPSFFFSFAHMDLIDPVIAACSDVILKIKTGRVQLEGEMPQAPLAQKVRS